MIWRDLCVSDGEYRPHLAPIAAVSPEAGEVVLEVTWGVGWGAGAPFLMKPVASRGLVAESGTGLVNCEG